MSATATPDDVLSGRAHRERHPERVKAQDAAYYARNRERLKQRRCLAEQARRSA